MYIFSSRALDQYVIVGDPAEAVLQSQMKSSTVTWVATGEWLDEEDINQRFEGKPTQRDHILNNAKRFTDPGTNAVKYEVLTYKSEYKDTEQRTEERKRQVSTEERIKPAKKAKIAQIKNDGEADPDEKQVSISQSVTKKIAAFGEWNASMSGKLQELVTEAKSAELKEYIPGHVLRKAAEMEEDVIQLKETAEKIQQEKKCGKVALALFLREIASKRDECKKLTEKLKTYITDAEEAHAEEGAKAAGA